MFHGYNLLDWHCNHDPIHLTYKFKNKSENIYIVCLGKHSLASQFHKAAVSEILAFSPMEYERNAWSLQELGRNIVDRS